MASVPLETVKSAAAAARTKLGIPAPAAKPDPHQQRREKVQREREALRAQVEREHGARVRAEVEAELKPKHQAEIDKTVAKRLAEIQSREHNATVRATRQAELEREFQAKRAAGRKLLAAAYGKELAEKLTPDSIYTFLAVQIDGACRHVVLPPSRAAQQEAERLVKALLHELQLRGQIDREATLMSTPLSAPRHGVRTLLAVKPTADELAEALHSWATGR